MPGPQRLPPARATLPKCRHALAFVAVLSLLGPTPAQAFGDPIDGRQLAVAWCSGCHQVDPRTQLQVTDAVPSFRAIAMMPSTTSMSIRAFLSTSHDVMPNFRLTEPQINDVGAYILSLRPRPPG